jgi:hypothetical protein
VYPQVVKNGTFGMGSLVVVVGIVCGPVGVEIDPNGDLGGPHALGCVQVRVGSF